MKAPLEFDLPAENEEHDSALYGAHYKRIIDDLFNLLRNKKKYENKKSIPITELQEWLRAEMLDL